MGEMGYGSRPATDTVAGIAESMRLKPCAYFRRAAGTGCPGCPGDAAGCERAQFLDVVARLDRLAASDRRAALLDEDVVLDPVRAVELMRPGYVKDAPEYRRQRRLI